MSACKVNEGDDLALIYSPQLYTAQTEFVTSLESNSSSRFSVGNSDLREMARENLSELGMTQDQIESLSTSRKPESRIRIKSPQSGTVIEKSAVEGDYVKTGQKLLQIADLTSVWMMLDLFPDDAANVRFGQQVEAEIQSMPGEVFTGRVAFIDPTVNKTNSNSSRSGRSDEFRWKASTRRLCDRQDHGSRDSRHTCLRSCLVRKIHQSHASASHSG